MTLKELRLNRSHSQEQLATMAGLNIRTIQRIESGQKASLESLKCIASVLQVDVSILNQEKYMIDKRSDHWEQLPLWLRWWFAFNFMALRPTRRQATNIELMCHVSGFLFCCAGSISERALVGGLVLISTAYFTHLLLWQGDMYGVWFSPGENT